MPPSPDECCEHGTAWDVHCCNCHSGFLFDLTSCRCTITDDDINWDYPVDDDEAKFADANVFSDDDDDPWADLAEREEAEFRLTSPAHPLYRCGSCGAPTDGTRWRFCNPVCARCL